MSVAHAVDTRICKVVEPAWFGERFLARFLVDPRDVIFVRWQIIISALMVPLAVACFAAPSFPWLVYIVYVLVMVNVIDRFLLMTHACIHRPIYKHAPMNWYLEAGMCWMFGATPFSFYAHHVAMHHAEANMGRDLSSTLDYQRDSLAHWLHYMLKFQLIGVFTVSRYFYETGKTRVLQKFLLGEFGFWTTCALLSIWKPLPTLLLFVAPVLIVRFFLMAGNFAQHAFIDPSDPADALRNSITLVNTRHNERCYNDGYHAVHHERPGMHYSEMPAHYEETIERYHKAGAVVFSGINDYIEVWALLMRRRFDKLAEHYVRAPGDERSDAEIAAYLQSLTHRFPAEAIVPYRPVTT